MPGLGDVDESIEDVDATDPPICLASISRRLIIGCWCSNGMGDRDSEGLESGW